MTDQCVVVYPDGCSRSLPLAAALALMAECGRRDGLQMFAAVPANPQPSESVRRTPDPTPPFTFANTDAWKRRVIDDVMRTTMSAAAIKHGVSRYTILMVMRRAGVRKDRWRKQRHPAEASAL